MEEIRLTTKKCMKPCKQWDKLPTSTGAGILPSTVLQAFGIRPVPFRTLKAAAIKENCRTRSVPSLTSLSPYQLRCIRHRVRFGEDGEAAISWHPTRGPPLQRCKKQNQAVALHSKVKFINRVFPGSEVSEFQKEEVSQKFPIGFVSVAITDHTQWSESCECQVRFLEFMPFDGNSWSANRLVPQVGVGFGPKEWASPSFSLICKDWKKGDGKNY